MASSSSSAIQRPRAPPFLARSSPSPRFPAMSGDGSTAGAGFGGAPAPSGPGFGGAPAQSNACFGGAPAPGSQPPAGTLGPSSPGQWGQPTMTPWPAQAPQMQPGANAACAMFQLMQPPFMQPPPGQPPVAATLAQPSAMCMPQPAAQLLHTAANLLMAQQSQPPAALPAAHPTSWHQQCATPPPVGTEAPTMIGGRMWLPAPHQSPMPCSKPPIG